MEHRNFHPLAQRFFNIEALRRFDILQVDAAEGWLERGDDIDHLLDGRGVDLDVEDVHAGEFLEEDGLAFHDGLRGERPDIAEAEDGRAVGNHGHEIGARRVIGRRARIVANGKTGGGDARRIGEREVALVAERLGGGDLELSGAGITVEEKRLLVDVSTCGAVLRPRFVTGAHDTPAIFCFRCGLRGTKPPRREV